MAPTSERSKLPIDEGVYAFHALKLWNYWTEVHKIYTQYSQIITGELSKNLNGDIVIHFRMSERQIKVNRLISPILTL